MGDERSLRLTLEYDGAGFHGWARQPGLRTVEGTLGDALERIWPGACELAVAGRTDAGVHASGQVASAHVSGGPPDGRAALALNQLLPPDLAVTAAARAPDGFHARFSALARCYEYRVLCSRVPAPLRAGRTYRWPTPLDAAALAACAAALPGEHDFRAFTPAETQHRSFRRQVLLAAWRADADELVLRIEADAFLRHMVRILVGTMLEVASGGRDPATLGALLAGGDRRDAGHTAPPQGLCLVGVRYAGV